MCVTAQCTRSSTCADRTFLCSVCRYSASDGRTCKPFNPLLGETYELVDKDRKFRFLAEKVVHHPTVLAAHCEGSGWNLDGDLEVKSKFWGRCIELKPFGKLEVSSCHLLRCHPSCPAVYVDAELCCSEC